MSRPIQALIDLSALEYNLSIVRRHAPNSRVMAVIKADAYGHGLLRAAEALARAEGFAMLELDAAVRDLRKRGWKKGRRIELPMGSAFSFEAPGGQRVALFELSRPAVVEHFAGRRDF